MNLASGWPKCPICGSWLVVTWTNRWPVVTVQTTTCPVIHDTAQTGRPSGGVS